MHDKDSSDYTELTDLLKTYKPHAKIMESVWLIGSYDPVEIISIEVLERLHNDDKYFVVELKNNYGFQLSPKVGSWIEKYLPIGDNE